jgi:hypothetical protein
LHAQQIFLYHFFLIVFKNLLPMPCQSIKPVHINNKRQELPNAETGKGQSLPFTRSASTLPSNARIEFYL